MGDLGRRECLVFEGMETFHPADLRRRFDLSLEMHARSGPSAPLTDYLAWLERVVRQGFLQSGFARVVVTATADRAAQRIRVSVTEGPRFKCGEVKITGLDAALTEQLRQRLSEAALDQPTHLAGPAPFLWPWRAGKPAPADPASLAMIEEMLVAALADLNRHGARLKVELALDEERRQADLLVRVTEPGMAGTVDEIVVEGLRRNTREELLAFLELRPGRPLLGNVTNEVIRRLYDSGRFSGHRARLLPLAEAGRFKLELAVVEHNRAPLLREELTAEQQAFLKLREWLLGWEQRPEDWLLEFEATRNGQRTHLQAALSQAGLAILVREPASPTTPPVLRAALVASARHVGYYSGPQRAKLTGPAQDFQVRTSIALVGDPRDGERSGSFTFGVGFGNKSGGAPYALQMELAPVALVASAHAWAEECHLEQGTLTIRSRTNQQPAYELAADVATGRLLHLRLTWPTNETRLALRFEEGAFARVLREVAAASAGFTNALDAQWPWSSSLALLGRELRTLSDEDLLEVLGWTGKLGTGPANAQEWIEALTVLEALPWSELLRELAGPVNAADEIPILTDRQEDFPQVIEELRPGAATGSDWMRLAAPMVLTLNDTLYPRESWPWRILRSATLVAAGEGQWVTNDLARLAASEDLGPLGCLLAARALGRSDPRLAVSFAQLGAGRATPATVQEDLRVLLGGDLAGPKFLRRALQQAPAFREPELRTLLKLGGTNSLPLVLEAVAALRANPSLPPEAALAPVIVQRWPKELRPWLLTDLAEVCLTGPALATDREQAAQATGWLREAAEAGYARAQLLLGKCYAMGVGVRTDTAAAAVWLRLAAAQQYPHSACQLGQMYQRLGNRAQAQAWFLQGTKEDCTLAELGLGLLLLEGKPTTPALREEGRGWLRKAAARGSAEAESYLGFDAERNNEIESALGHYRAAATKGALTAQKKLGDLLSDPDRTTPDYVEAWVWFSQAARNGDRIAAAQARLVGRKLTPEQLEEARRRLSLLD